MDAREMKASWRLSLDSQRRSPHTIESYMTAVGQLLDWLAAQGLEADLANPDHVRAWLAAKRGDWAGSTAQVKLAAVRSFAQFLVDEGELATSGVHRVAWPTVDETIPPAFTGAQIDALIATCPPKTFTGIRDAAIITLLYDSLLRSDELLSMRRKSPGELGDVDLVARTVRVRRGKGGKERYSTFSAQTALRLDRYQRQRARHKAASIDAYWLANGRGALTYDAMYWVIRRRGQMAGIHAFPHMARAGGAIQWRRRKGSTEGLMTIAGWTDLKMVQRYTRAAEVELALEEARQLHDHG